MKSYTLCICLTLLFALSSVSGDDDVVEVDNNKTTTYWYGLMRLFERSGSISNDSAKEFCFTYPSSLYSPNATKLYKLKELVKVNPCDESGQRPKLDDQTLYLMKSSDNCTIDNFINYTKEDHGAGLILISKESLNLSESSSKGLDIVGFITNHTAESILVVNTTEAVVQLIDIVSDDSFEWSTVLLWIMACFCVSVGALTGPYIDMPGLSTHEQILDGNETAPDHKNLQIQFTVKLILMLVAFICAILLLLHFFYSYLVYFFMAVFCIASGRATFEIIIQVLNICHMDARMPRIKGYGVHRLAVWALCIALPVTWFVLRHDPYIWILQDFLGICFCIHLIQTLRIPSLKICSVLLSLLFFYDIFFVFITPYITSNGKSIMVEVATGAGTGETLPLLLQLPHLRSGPYSMCVRSGFSLLGFGDIILPGFLVCFTHAYDIAKGNKYRPFFITAMLGYAFGLSVAFVVLYLSQTGQPALLYIVPSVLIPLYVVGGCKNQLGEMWRGAIRTSAPEP